MSIQDINLKSQLKSHQLIHKNEKTFECNECHQTIQTNAWLLEAINRFTRMKDHLFAIGVNAEKDFKTKLDILIDTNEPFI